MHITLIAVALVLSASQTPLIHAVDGDKAQTEDRVICKDRRQTGTRFTKKICKSASQWERIAEENRAGLKELVDRPQIKICGPQGCD